MDDRKAGTVDANRRKRLSSTFGEASVGNERVETMRLRKLFLVRHPKVTEESRGICYGQSDVALALGWESSYLPLLDRLRRLDRQEMPRKVWCSDLSRSAEPARWIARQLKMEYESTQLLRERFFGRWQTLPWDSIPEEEIKLAHEMIESPDQFRPGHGETTRELQNRSVRWFQTALRQCEGEEALLMVAHSGSITSIAGALRQLHPRDWGPYYLKPSQWLEEELTPEYLARLQTHPDVA